MTEKNSKTGQPLIDPRMVEIAISYYRPESWLSNDAGFLAKLDRKVNIALEKNDYESMDSQTGKKSAR